MDAAAHIGLARAINAQGNSLSHFNIAQCRRGCGLLALGRAALFQGVAIRKTRERAPGIPGWSPIATRSRGISLFFCCGIPGSSSPSHLAVCLACLARFFFSTWKDFVGVVDGWSSSRSFWCCWVVCLCGGGLFCLG